MYVSYREVMESLSQNQTGTGLPPDTLEALEKEALDVAATFAYVCAFCFLMRLSSARCGFCLH